jgi:hypothetical protein
VLFELFDDAARFRLSRIISSTSAGRLSRESVCSPSRRAARGYSTGVPKSLIGLPTVDEFFVQAMRNMCQHIARLNLRLVQSLGNVSLAKGEALVTKGGSFRGASGRAMLHKTSANRRGITGRER